MSKVNSGVALPLWVVTLGALLVFLSMAALVIGVMQGPGTGDASETPPLYDEQMVVSLYEKANPAVVRVETVITPPPTGSVSSSRMVGRVQGSWWTPRGTFSPTTT